MGAGDLSRPALVQIYAAGLWLFAGQPEVHPVLGYFVFLAVLIQVIWVIATRHRERLSGPAATGLAMATVAPLLVIFGPSLGGPLSALHPLVGVALVLAQYELVRRT